MDSTSGVTPVSGPLSHGDVDVTVYFLRGCALDGSIPHHHAHRLTTVQTRRIDPNRLARKDPADRQGLETSLRKPFLLSVNGHAILRGLVVEGSKRCDQIRVGV